MRPLVLALAAGTLLPLTGCLSISGRVGLATGLGDVATTLNASRGTHFSGSMMTTGVGYGGEMYGIIGLSRAEMTGRQTSAATGGGEEELRVEQTDTEVSFSWPVATTRLFMINPGFSMGSRSTRLFYSRNGQDVSFDDDVALVVRPFVKAVTSIGDRVLLSTGAGYEFGFLEDGVSVRGGGTARTAMPGPQANVTVTVFFCSGCVGG